MPVIFNKMTIYENGVCSITDVEQMFPGRDEVNLSLAHFFVYTSAYTADCRIRKYALKVVVC